LARPEPIQLVPVAMTIWVTITVPVGNSTGQEPFARDQLSAFWHAVVSSVSPSALAPNWPTETGWSCSNNDQDRPEASLMTVPPLWVVFTASGMNTPPLPSPAVQYPCTITGLIGSVAAVPARRAAMLVSVVTAPDAAVETMAAVHLVPSH